MNTYIVTYNRCLARTILANDKVQAIQQLAKLLDTEKGYQVDLTSELRGLQIINATRRELSTVDQNK